jgi:hypothetical protein
MTEIRSGLSEKRPEYKRMESGENISGEGIPAGKVCMITLADTDGAGDVPMIPRTKIWKYAPVSREVSG